MTTLQAAHKKFNWFSKSKASLLLALVISLFANNVMAQIKSNSAPTNQSVKDSIPIIVYGDNFDEIPTFKAGGDVGMRKFIIENLKYPKDQCLTGPLYVSFTVDTLGNVKDAIILRGITKEANEEALRVVSLMKFIPAIRKGKLIEVKMYLPINFTPAEERKKK